jgi:AcrR family transcriptional regulator
MTRTGPRQKNEQPAKEPATRTGTKQDRSIERRAQIAEAAIEVLARHGVAGLTHRMVARKAGVSLAATTYHYDSKFDIVAEASRRTLDGYVTAFHEAAARCAPGADGAARFREFTARLVRNAASRDRARALCWAEITLDARRHEESLALTRQWFEEVAGVWIAIAEAAGLDHPAETARSAIDLVIGLLLVSLALGLSEDQIGSVLEGGVDPLIAWALPGPEQPPAEPPHRTSRKAAETRERIIRAAIHALIEDSPGAVSYRAIATRAGLAPAGPFYHFPTIDGLLAAAQQRLFEESKQRYRTAAAQTGGAPSIERLIDRTATVLVREATEFAQSNIASYAIWLQAGRSPELRPMIWSAIADQYAAWKHVVAQLTHDQRPLDALLLFSLFVGKHIRILSVGSCLDDLAMVRIASDFWFRK